ncbi:MAG: hypothetical protein Q9168_003974 [Polycauliona sp. 1 TL-2023]
METNFERDSQIHKVVACILWDLGKPENPAVGGYRSSYNSSGEDPITDDQLLDPGFTEYYLALDIGHWWEVQFDSPLAAVIALRAPHQKDIETLIMAFTEKNKDSLDSFHQVQSKIRCGLKLLVCEQISSLAILSILIAYYRQLENLTFHQLYNLVDVLQASPSIIDSVEKNTARFKDRLETKRKNCERLP